MKLIMDLLKQVDKNNQVFLFNEQLEQKVWEPKPITKFDLTDKDKENEWIKQNTALNKPTAGIIFNGEAHIGTNDGKIYTPDKTIERIPYIHTNEYTYMLMNQNNLTTEEKKLFLK